MKYCAILLVAIFLAACAPPPYLYYGTSSSGYYKAVKKQDAKSVSQYKASLEDVFKKSAKMGKPVPPGLYCDYAMLLLSEKKPEEAKVYFLKEKEAWVESRTMMDFLMQRYEIGK